MKPLNSKKVLHEFLTLFAYAGVKLYNVNMTQHCWLKITPGFLLEPKKCAKMLQFFTIINYIDYKVCKRFPRCMKTAETGQCDCQVFR